MLLRRYLFLTTAFALYLACAAYLLLRAQGYSFNAHEARLVETAIVTAQLPAPAATTLDVRTLQGAAPSFDDVPPGRHVLTITPTVGPVTQVVVDTAPRSVTILEHVHLPGSPRAIETLHREALSAAASTDARLLAVLTRAEEAPVLDILSLLAPEPERIQRIVLPADDVRTVTWLSSESLVLGAETETVFVRLPGTAVRLPVPGNGTTYAPLTDRSFLARLANGDVLLLSADGARMEKIAERVDAVRLTPTGEVLLAQGGTIRSLRDDRALPSLPDGVRVAGALRRPGGMLAWDLHGQGWSLADGTTAWHPAGSDLRNAVALPDGTTLLIGTGTLIDAQGTVLLRMSGEIDAVLPVSDGRVLVGSGSRLLDCGLTLRICSELARGVDEAFVEHGRVVVRQGDVVRRIRL